MSSIYRHARGVARLCGAAAHLSANSTPIHTPQTQRCMQNVRLASQHRHMSTSAGEKYYMIEYTYTADILTKRTPFREKHLKLLQTYVDKGVCVLGGALNPPKRAHIVFKCGDKSVAEQFVQQDPYVLNELVEKYEINEWTVVIGTQHQTVNPAKLSSLSGKSDMDVGSTNEITKD